MLTTTISPLSALTARLSRAMPLSDDARRAIEVLPATMQELAPNTGFIHPGDRSTSCCLVLSGWMGRFTLLPNGERQFLALHIAGDIPDLQTLHLPVVDHGICAFTHVSVALIPHEAIHDLMVRYPDAAAALWHEVLVIASITNEWLIGLGRRSGPKRLAHLLYELYVRQKAAGLVKEEGRCALPLTQTVLADALGLTSVHVNRILQEIRAEQMIQLMKRTLIIRDWSRLKVLAEFDPLYLHLDQRLT
ncbi:MULTISPECIES: Crp/Fnr family transcriptional regulator [unclassified Methylobacterium]|uniref:Crp/Fnr family transcriptional regulator n=1 Tax=unclassified Methylobacterium TaxID=2615210 RepID=UPI0011C1F787|nr:MULTISPECIES: Crp/Fnr family transcriptional regulator [unclassified Methylobacterium]QEE41326.1 Crp/Fnr family transcriptional regulator [Methylobacterium sp. WL1]TXN57756.1 Crp/Fnr family transcriptional regulator [Methylobacterium sp. WL2]